MKFACLVHHTDSAFNAMSDSERSQLDADSLAYDQSLEKRGKMILAEALQSGRSCKIVKRRNGKILVTDGPFAEAKEQLVGFVLVEAYDMDEAVEIASNIPLARSGLIEVRAFYDFDA